MTVQLSMEEGGDKHIFLNKKKTISFQLYKGTRCSLTHCRIYFILHWQIIDFLSDSIFLSDFRKCLWNKICHSFSKYELLSTSIRVNRDMLFSIQINTHLHYNKCSCQNFDECSVLNVLQLRTLVVIFYFDFNIWRTKCILVSMMIYL